MKKASEEREMKSRRDLEKSSIERDSSDSKLIEIQYFNCLTN